MHKIPIKVGDVVYAEGASALLGDVVSIDEDEDAVEVRWRQAFSTESSDDLVVVVEPEVPAMARVSESSEVLAFMEHAFQYRSVQNIQRSERGAELIRSHPDFGKMMDSDRDELLTAATDTIADVLHALNAAGVLAGSGRVSAGGIITANAVLGRAGRAFEGDFEDELPHEGDDRG